MAENIERVLVEGRYRCEMNLKKVYGNRGSADQNVH